MRRDNPFLLEDVEALRSSLRTGNDRRSALFDMLRSSARAAPEDFAWFVPFVALVTRDPGDVERARNTIRAYVAKLEPMSFCSGLQFHFWCFAFPHAKVSLYFQWLCTIDAFDPEEEENIRQKLVAYHFVNFFYGLRTKPDPECVDNQTLSLAFSTALVGVLFSEGENPSAMARVMREEGLARLPTVLGNMDPSGYSGEGSSYMDCVNGPAVPLAMELLERVTGERDLLFKPFPPNGAQPVKVLRMVAREFMPGGLLLPWDNYGYQFGVRSTLAYGARKTGEPLFSYLLEKECILTYDIGIGWAYDDLVWTLVWWPVGNPVEACALDWAEPGIGGALVSTDRLRYCAQLWDESTPEVPTRAHVNPNMVLFNGFGIPLSADGSPTPAGVPRFQFADTWRVIHHFIGAAPEYNYGDGCAGAHSVLVVDGVESLRAHTEAAQLGPVDARPGASTLRADVTPIYRENFPDIRRVERRTTLHEDTFFTVEDRFVSDGSHEVASRFLLRPEWTEPAFGVSIRAPEGVTLHLAELLGGCTVQRQIVVGHPAQPDGQSRLVDFVSVGKDLHRLFVAFIGCDVSEETVENRFRALADLRDGYPEVHDALFASGILLDLSSPPHMEAGLPVSRTWWYGKRIARPTGPAYLRLPLGLIRPALFLDGREVDLSPWSTSGTLIRPLVPIPTGGTAGDAVGDALEVVLRTDVPVSHYDVDGDGTIGMAGGIGICRPVEAEHMVQATYKDGELTVATDRRVFRVPYALMED